MKKIVVREALLAYRNFERPFEIHTDACDIQLGSVISQNGKPCNKSPFWGSLFFHLFPAVLMCDRAHTGPQVFNAETLESGAIIT